MSLLIFFGIAALFAYFALNLGEKRGQAPGWRPVLTVLFVCLLGYLLWPVIGPMATFLMSPILANYHK